MDITEGVFTALLILASAAAHDQPVTAHVCPDIAAFQVSFPGTIVHPFEEAPPAILRWGQELLSTGVPDALVWVPVAADPSHAPGASGSASLPLPLLGGSDIPRGADPPSVAAPSVVDVSSGLLLVSLGAAVLGGVPPQVPSHRPDLDGVDGPPLSMGGSHSFRRSCNGGRLPPCPHSSRFFPPKPSRFSDRSPSCLSISGLGFSSSFSTAGNWRYLISLALSQRKFLPTSTAAIL